MKFLSVLSVLWCLFSFTLHDYFFSFAEIQFNKKESVYQISLSTTAHDFEFHMESKGMKIGHIENVEKNSEVYKQIEKELKSGFTLLSNKTDQLNYSLIGFEVDLKDNLTFYLKSDKTEEVKSFEIIFNLMMETFQDQQNKINFLHNGDKQSLTFVNSNRSRTIELK